MTGIRYAHTGCEYHEHYDHSRITYNWRLPVRHCSSQIHVRREPLPLQFSFEVRAAYHVVSAINAKDCLRGQGFAATRTGARGILSIRHIRHHDFQSFRSADIRSANDARAFAAFHSTPPALRFKPSLSRPSLLCSPLGRPIIDLARHPGALRWGSVACVSVDLPNRCERGLLFPSHDAGRTDSW